MAQWGIYEHVVLKRTVLCGIRQRVNLLLHAQILRRFFSGSEIISRLKRS
jgi:hypothetical protein